MGVQRNVKKTSTPLLSGIGLLAILPTLLVSPHARADAEDPLNLIAGVSVVHDDNLFRKPSGSEKSDVITVSTVGLKYYKPYSLQRFELEADLQDHRYNTFDYNNFTALNYAAAWRWSLTPYLHGNLTSDRKESLNSFSDSPDSGTRNLRTDENQRFDGVLDVSGSWRILGGVAQSTRTNQASTPELGTRLNTAEGGLRYDFPSGSSFSYIARKGQGKYFNQSQSISSTFSDNRFDQIENEVRMIWPITAKTTIDARAAHISRTHDHASELDYAGNVGNINVNWAVTEKTSLNASLGRELSSYQSENSNVVSTDRFSIGPLWQITEKTALRGRYDYAQRDYRGSVSDRVDHLRTAMIALEWKALRTLTVSASLQDERRNSNVPGQDFKSMQAGIAAQLAF